MEFMVDCSEEEVGSWKEKMVKDPKSRMLGRIVNLAASLDGCRTSREVHCLENCFFFGGGVKLVFTRIRKVLRMA